jgi:hypothetical protein
MLFTTQGGTTVSMLLAEEAGGTVRDGVRFSVLYIMLQVCGTNVLVLPTSCEVLPICRRKCVHRMLPQTSLSVSGRMNSIVGQHRCCRQSPLSGQVAACTGVPAVSSVALPKSYRPVQSLRPARSRQKAGWPGLIQYYCGPSHLHDKPQSLCDRNGATIPHGRRGLLKRRAWTARNTDYDAPRASAVIFRAADMVSERIKRDQASSRAFQCMPVER